MLTIFQFAFCLLILVNASWSLSPHQSRAIGIRIPSGLGVVSRRQRAFLDGAEWESVEPILSQDAELGFMTTVVGMNRETSDRFIGVESIAGADGMKVDQDCYLSKNSIAQVPAKMADEIAISTLVASLSVHRLLTLLKQLQTKHRGPDRSHKVVIVGGCQHGIFIARALANFGVDVCLVSAKEANFNKSRVQMLKPVLGDGIGFAAQAREFDVLVDTIGDERTSDYYSMSELMGQHKCSIYFPTLTESLRIISREGLISGPGRVASYLKACRLGERSAAAIIPQDGFGKTLETLLDNGITYQWKWSDGAAIRSWSLPEFWEIATWPRDSDSDVRFGFPTTQEFLSEEVEPEMSVDAQNSQERAPNRDFVRELNGVKGVTREVVAKRKDCVLLLSAKYCRTCRYLLPQYYRYAQLHAQSRDVLFAVADAGDSVGKELSKCLNVTSVPCFVFFQQGKQLGKPLPVTRLPSSQLETALDRLASPYKDGNGQTQ